ncbi:MAG: hypothetical protein LLF98_01980 [Clostridium sp.]|uniref:hypothetical protein n=1 Tax=Clostridium sp. TaxID=1506 RepID=UPI0025C0CA6E|nr:hypothetical protein [Clostridium sp.]MCE5220050.1 hypothetical protein [Clostridium sp.]
MAQFPFSNLMDGTKKLATRIYNATGELFTSTNPGVVSLTGSKVEEEQIITNLQLAAGATSSIIVCDVSNSSFITFAITGVNTTGNLSWSATAAFLSSSQTRLEVSQNIISTTSTPYGISAKLPVKSKKIGLYLKNETVSDTLTFAVGHINRMVN